MQNVKKVQINVAVVFSFRLNTKWLEPRHGRRIDVTEMTGNSVRKAYSFSNAGDWRNSPSTAIALKFADRRGFGIKSTVLHYI